MKVWLLTWDWDGEHFAEVCATREAAVRYLADFTRALMPPDSHISDDEEMVDRYFRSQHRYGTAGWFVEEVEVIT